MTFNAHVGFSISMTSSGRWFFRGPPVSTTNKTDLHDITEIVHISHMVQYNNNNIFRNIFFSTLIKIAVV
jgi:hypothetical protein